jgi:hypothetical protein
MSNTKNNESVLICLRVSWEIYNAINKRIGGDKKETKTDLIKRILYTELIRKHRRKV